MEQNLSDKTKMKQKWCACILFPKDINSLSSLADDTENWHNTDIGRAPKSLPAFALLLKGGGSDQLSGVLILLKKNMKCQQSNLRDFVSQCVWLGWREGSCRQLQIAYQQCLNPPQIFIWMEHFSSESDSVRSAVLWWHMGCLWDLFI